MSKREISKLIDELEWLYKKYSNELRASTQPHHFKRVNNEVKGYKYHPESRLVRESLLEHVGVLPMIATTLYPFIDDGEVDLGEALTMLAIHDIGELITGDEMVFKKKKGSGKKEQEEALKLLDKSYHDLFVDIETQSTPTGKFAKSVDKLAGDIVDYVTPPEITIWRFKHFLGVEPDEIVPLMVKHKQPYMLWNPFLTELHKELIRRTKAKIEKNNQVQ